MDQAQALAQILGSKGIDQFGDGLRVDGAQDLLHLFQRHRFGAKAQHLVEQADGIAHAALGAARNRQQGIAIGMESFGRDDVLQMPGNLGRGNAAEVKALAAAEHGGRESCAARSWPGRNGRAEAALPTS